MSKHEHNIIEATKPGFKAHGIFHEGKQELRSVKPLIVLIHGTGTNAKYFDNEFHSIPAKFNKAGLDVLNMNRAGYGGNPLPEVTTKPILDSIPLYADLIRKTYDERSNGKNGIILVGHSLGGAIALSLAAFEGGKLPLIGVSALGIIPQESPPAGLVEMLKAEPGNPRLVVEPSLENIVMFMGPLELVDEAMLLHPSIPEIFEPGFKSELLEWFDVAWYKRLVNEVAPNVRVPLQFLAAEYELGWRGISEAQAPFDKVAKLFVNTPKLDARLLPGGGHNFEFSKNASILQEAREEFINSVIYSESKLDDPAAFNEIPLLDFALANDPASKPEFLKSLRRAIVNVGFLYIKNTTVSPVIQANLIKKGIEALELPLEEKLKVEMANSKHFLGYARLGTEITAMKPDYREQYDFATEVPPPGPDEPVHRNLRGPNQWLDESVIPGFRQAVEDYLSEIATFALQFSHLIALSLDMPAHSFSKYFEEPQHNKLKLVKYPSPPTITPETGGAIQGVGPHKDGSFLTFLLQGTPHHGLEIQNKNGDWINAPPIPGTMVINIGRSLQALTGGVCTATTHRVNLSPSNFLSPNNTPLGPRYSFPVFQGVRTDIDARMEIPRHIRELVRDESVRSEAEGTFDGMFGDVEAYRRGIFMARVLSHPDVGRRWYPEVLAEALEARAEAGRV